MRPKPILAIPAVALAASFSLALGGGVLSEFGPEPSYTGAPAIGSKPAEWDCTVCHFTEGVNNLNTPGGAVQLLDLPETYSAGQTYRIRVRLSTDSTALDPGRMWGFQLTAVRASDGEGCGTFVLDDPDTLLVVPGAGDLASRSYVEHKMAGIRQGLSSPVEWTFSWQAPITPQDTAFFYCAANAGDGDLSPGGDFIFTAADTVLDFATPVLPVSWGGVKRRYR